MQKTLASIFDPKQIEKQNAAFHRMSKKRQRIAIAKDVLAQLKREKYVAVRGSYVVSYDLDQLSFQETDEHPFDLQEALLGNAPECSVCGLGAAFCSMARLGDKVELEDVPDIYEHLEPVFGMHQLALIEYAFEGCDSGYEGNNNLSEEEVATCVRFCKKWPDHDKRLAAIFRNVVRNEGTFRP